MTAEAMTIAMDQMTGFPWGLRGSGMATDGMLTRVEAETLLRLADGRIVLELGSWCGLSTLTMARSAVHVVAVDWHGGDREMGRQDTLAEFLNNLRRHPELGMKVTPIIGRFEQILPLLADDTFGLVYIDGAHDYESVHRDTGEAMRLAMPGGYLAWHDADREPVMRAAQGTGLKVQSGPDRLAWARLE